MKIHTFQSVPQAVSAIKEAYTAGHTYLEGKFQHNGHYFKIRMNKDHDMAQRNNGNLEHVCSIVYSGRGVATFFYRTSLGYYIQQKKQYYRWTPDMDSEEAEDYDYYDRDICPEEMNELEEIVSNFLELVYEQEPEEEE
jgi:hypothetical protein